jgi:ribosomal protein L11 methyltransferase
MNYIEIKCFVKPLGEGNEIMIALLSELGCESFMEFEEGVCAYIQSSFFSEEKLKEIHLPQNAGFSYSFEISQIKDENWNALWESNYEPVWIDNCCYVRAPFHETKSDALYEIVIEPKMSFGTAHHETTSLMLSYLLKEDCKDKNILDMGSGTGVLAILTSLRGSKTITAIDNDEWAYENCIENCQRNEITNIECILGDADTIKNDPFDIIIANINRNILLRDIPKYVVNLKQKGILFLSGFYEEEDLQLLSEKAVECGLIYDSYKTKNRWCAAKFYLR